MKTKDKFIPALIFIISLALSLLTNGCKKQETIQPVKQQVTVAPDSIKIEVENRSYSINGVPGDLLLSIGNKCSSDPGSWCIDTAWSYYKVSKKTIEFKCKTTDTLLYDMMINLKDVGGPDTCYLYVSIFYRNKLIAKDSGGYCSFGPLLWGNIHNMATRVDTVFIAKHI